MSLNTVICIVAMHQKISKGLEDLTTSHRTVRAYNMRDSNTYTKPYTAGKNHTVPSLH